MSNFLSPFRSLHLFQQFQADCVYKKSLEDACYFLLKSVFISFLFIFIVSVVSVEDVPFLSPFHSLHLFQQFQADCVYKKYLLKMLVTSCYSLFH